MVNAATVVKDCSYDVGAVVAHYTDY